MIGNSITSKILICEGFATGATLHEALGYMVFCAMNAGNLEETCRIALLGYPTAIPLICADNDHGKAKNTGLTVAANVAYDFGIDLTWPDLCGEHCKCTDFNDVANCKSMSGASNE